MDDPAKLVLVPKQLTESVLRPAQDSVFTDHMNRSGQDGAFVSGCGVDIHSNALDVMLSQPDEELEKRIQAEHPDVPIYRHLHVP